MWTRYEIKKEAKKTLSRIYWTAVGGCFIFGLLGGGTGTPSFTYTFPSGSNQFIEDFQENLEEYNDNNNDDYDNSDGFVDSGIDESQGLTNVVYSDDYGYSDSDESDYYYNDDLYDYSYDDLEETDKTSEETLEESLEIISRELKEFFESGGSTIVLVILGIVFGIFTLAIAFCLFITEPIRVGLYGMLIKGRRKQVSVGDMFSTFSKGYMNIVKSMFLVHLYTRLWSLLFIIPGIIKGYEYRMVPYIMAENRDISSKRAFELSREMMYGNKWKTFVLDLSFIGWAILSVVTRRIVGIFFYLPYYNLTICELFEVLRRDVLIRKKATHSELGRDEELTQNIMSQQTPSPEYI